MNLLVDRFPKVFELKGKKVSINEQEFVKSNLTDSIDELTGGAIGIALGSAFSFLIAWVLRVAMELNWSFAFPLSGALLALGVSAAVGLVFGIYPARQAAKKSPIEALRYE